MADNNHSSPKRKRDSIPPTPPSSSPLNSFPLTASPQKPSARASSPMRLSTNIPGAVVSLEDAAQGSPRTKVAYNFQGLQLEGGQAVSKLDLAKGYEMENRVDSRRGDDEAIVRKRMKVLKGEDREIPETPKAFAISIGQERTVDPALPEKASHVVLHNDLDPVIFKGNVSRVKGEGLHRAYPSINRLSDSKSRQPKKRAGTPPLFGAADASLEPGASTIVDPDRAALTWHDDEITGHDPSDPEDDGEGINGIGFKPTAAIAYARTAKRRQQMEEYKSREAREARAKRSERRRASELSKNTASREEAETARRVRFLEAEANSIMPTSL